VGALSGDSLLQVNEDDDPETAEAKMEMQMMAQMGIPVDFDSSKGKVTRKRARWASTSSGVLAADARSIPLTRAVVSGTASDESAHTCCTLREESNRTLRRWRAACGSSLRGSTGST